MSWCPLRLSRTGLLLRSYTPPPLNVLTGNISRCPIMPLYTSADYKRLLSSWALRDSYASIRNVPGGTLTPHPYDVWPSARGTGAPPRPPRLQSYRACAMSSSSLLGSLRMPERLAPERARPPSPRRTCEVRPIFGRACAGRSRGAGMTPHISRPFARLSFESDR